LAKIETQKKELRRAKAKLAEERKLEDQICVVCYETLAEEDDLFDVLPCQTHPVCNICLIDFLRN